MHYFSGRLALPSRNKPLNCGIAFSLALHGTVIAFLLFIPPTPAITTQAPLIASIVKIPMLESKLHKPDQAPLRHQRQQNHLPSLQAPSLPTTDLAMSAATVTKNKDVAPTVSAAPVASVPVVIPPRFDAAYLNNPIPAYPPMARRKGEQGKVLLSVMVNADGSPIRVEVRNSSGSASLDQAALETVKRWRFIPASQAGDNIESTVLVPLTFRLEGRS